MEAGRSVASISLTMEASTCRLYDRRIAGQSGLYPNKPMDTTRDENGSDTNGYHSYYICFHISVRIRIRTRIAFGYIYEYGLTRLWIRIMSIEYGMNRIRRRSDTNIYSDIE